MKISVITATYNSSKTIIDVIKSVNNQSYENIEHIFVDGLSQDSTVELIKKNSKRDCLIISEKDNGIYDAFNKGLERSSGDIVCHLNSDDMYSDVNVLQKVSEVFKNSKIKIAYGDLKYVDQENKNVIKRSWFSGEYKRNKLFFGWMPPHPSTFIRRDFQKTIGKYNDNYKISADYDFMIRALKHVEEFQVAYIKHNIVYMRMGGASNKNIQSSLRKKSEDLQVIQSNEIGGLFTLLFKSLRKINQIKF